VTPPAPQTRLSHVKLVARDVRVLAEFYQRLTGLAVLGSEEYAELRTPCATLAICSAHAVESHLPRVAQAAANRSAIVEFQVVDVDLERHRLQGIVGDFVLEPVTHPWGCRSMLFRDPDGNLVSFFARR
jgi:catechol 2,3-dioxygenase-like lactoylglutathione lyase family enzyme